MRERRTRRISRLDDEPRIVVIEFEVRPLDSRVMEAWQRGKFPLSPNQTFALYLCWLAVGIGYAYNTRGSNLFLVIVAFGASFLAGLLGLRMLTEWRHRSTGGMVDVTVWYLLLKFAGHGAIAIPVSALERFGPSYDAAFLMELAPMVDAARGRES